MQILSNALPGLRDLRGPVVAGYMWLLFGWLLWAPQFDERSASNFRKTFYDLQQDLGDLGTVVALSVCAYLIGAVSQELSNALRVGWASVRFIPPTLGGSSTTSPAADYVAALRSQGISQIARDLGETFAGRGDKSEAGDSDALMSAQTELNDRADRAISESRRELSIPATLLVGEQPELFAEVDRLRAEGEFRLAVTPPLLCLIVLLAVKDSWLWLLALAAVLLLFVQGIKRDADSRRLIADAMSVEKVPSPSLKGFATWVNGDGLVEAIERARARRIDL